MKYRIEYEDLQGRHVFELETEKETLEDKEIREAAMEDANNNHRSGMNGIRIINSTPIK